MQLHDSDFVHGLPAVSAQNDTCRQQQELYNPRGVQCNESTTSCGRGHAGCVFGREHGHPAAGRPQTTEESSQLDSGVVPKKGVPAIAAVDQQLGTCTAIASRILWKKRGARLAMAVAITQMLINRSDCWSGKPGESERNGQSSLLIARAQVGPGEARSAGPAQG